MKSVSKGEIIEDERETCQQSGRAVAQRYRNCRNNVTVSHSVSHSAGAKSLVQSGGAGFWEQQEN